MAGNEGVPPLSPLLLNPPLVDTFMPHSVYRIGMHASSVPVTCCSDCLYARRHWVHCWATNRPLGNFWGWWREKMGTGDYWGHISALLLDRLL